ncbi:hypothetical protein KIPB_015759, partial [Kipferlia bialata]
YTQAVDLWALGCVAYELLMGRSPFYSPDPAMTYQSIMAGSVTIPEDVSTDAADLILSLLDPSPSSRPSLSSLHSHPFFRCSVSCLSL